ncbi:MAG: 50S ribosomal protein L11 methyltransferase [Pseudomonadales bacterium]
MTKGTRWLKLTLTLPRERVESVERELAALGAVSISLSDGADDPIIEPDPGATPLWPKAVMTALFEHRAGIADDLRTLTARWYGGLEEARGSLEISPLEDQDWSKTWREGLAARCFGDRLWVCPSYTAAPNDGRPVLVMDPGLAFGSGTHPTTQLCLSWLADQPLEECVAVDYGCGSGVLALAMHLLGSRRAFAVDHDPQALESTRENLARNGLDPGQIWIGPPDELPELHCDVLVANIFSRVLIELSDDFTELLVPGARLALSGVLNEQCAAVKQAFAAIEFDESRMEGEWALLVGQKRDSA